MPKANCGLARGYQFDGMKWDQLELKCNLIFFSTSYVPDEACYYSLRNKLQLPTQFDFFFMRGRQIRVIVLNGSYTLSVLK